MTIFQLLGIWLLTGVALFALVRAALLVKYWDQFSFLNPPQILEAFAEGLRFDLASLMVFGAVPMLLVALPGRWFRHRLWTNLHLSLLYLMLIVAAAVLIGDLIYYGHVKRHLTNELLFLGEDAGYLLEEALGYLPEFGLGLALIGGLGWWGWRQTRLEVRPARWGWAQYLLLFVTIGILGRGGLGMKPIVIVNAYSSGNTAQGNLTLNGVFSASHSTLNFTPVERLKVSQTEIEAALQLPSGHLQSSYPMEQDYPPHPPLARNLVILMVESLSPRYVDSFGGNDYGLTPNLDKLAQQGWRFTRFYSHGQRSVEGFQSILTGVPSLPGVPTVMDQASGYSRLAGIARENGYDTLFVNTTLRKAFLTDAFAATVGFPEYYGLEDMPLLLDYPEAERDRSLGWDYEALMWTLEKLKDRENPFLVFVSANTAHTPYPRLPERFERHTPGPHAEGGYLNALHYSDWAIGEFFEKARQEPWFDETLFVITADHVIAHFQQSTGLPEKFQIPLIFYAPQLLEPCEVPRVASHLDLPTTFIDALGWQGRFASLGSSLLQPESVPGFAVVREGSVLGILNEQGYLRHSLQQRLEAVDLTGGANPPNFQQLEQQLLSWDRLAFDLLQQNRWGQ